MVKSIGTSQITLVKLSKAIATITQIFTKLSGRKDYGM